MATKANDQGFEDGLLGRRRRNRHRFEPEKAADYDTGYDDAVLRLKEIGRGRPVRVRHLTG